MTNTYTFKSKDFGLMFCSLESASMIEPTEKMALISLNDPGLQPELDYSRWKHCLRVRFHDVTDPEEGEIFTEHMAESIIEYVVSLPKQVKFLVAHCFAGVSRSAGVVKFLTRYVFKDCFNHDFDLGYDLYNKYVFKTLVRVWKRDKSLVRHTPK